MLSQTCFEFENLIGTVSGLFSVAKIVRSGIESCQCVQAVFMFNFTLRQLGVRDTRGDKKTILL